jgi:hypothetical protein
MKDFILDSEDGVVTLTEENLRVMRLSIAELSRKAEIPYSTIVKYFHLIDPRGLPIPSLQNARKIAKVLDVPLEQIKFLGE